MHRHTYSGAVKTDTQNAQMHWKYWHTPIRKIFALMQRNFICFQTEVSCGVLSLWNTFNCSTLFTWHFFIGVYTQDKTRCSVCRCFSSSPNKQFILWLPLSIVVSKKHGNGSGNGSEAHVAVQSKWSFSWKVSQPFTWRKIERCDYW